MSYYYRYYVFVDYAYTFTRVMRNAIQGVSFIVKKINNDKFLY